MSGGKRYMDAAQVDSRVDLGTGADQTALVPDGNGAIQIAGTRTYPPSVADPVLPAPVDGARYLNTASGLWRVYRSGSWNDLVDVNSVQSLANKTLVNPVISGFGSTHDHSDAANGGLVPATSITYPNAGWQLTEVNGALDSITGLDGDVGGSGRISPDEPMYIGGMNLVGILAGTGRIIYSGTRRDIAWAPNSINTTGFAEGTYHVYYDAAGNLQVNLVIPNLPLVVYLGWFYHTGNMVGTVHNSGRARAQDIVTRLQNFTGRLGVFITSETGNPGGKVQTMPGDVQKIVSPACEVQNGLTVVDLPQVSSDDRGVSYFVWYKTVDDGWEADFYNLGAYEQGRPPTDRYNDITQNGSIALSADCTFTTGSTNVPTAADLQPEVSVGDFVFLDTDGHQHMNKVVGINAAAITLDSNYTGVGGVGASTVDKGLKDITPGNYVKHLVIRTLDGLMHMVYGQAEYPSLVAVLAAGGPDIPPAVALDSARMSYIAVQQGDIDLSDGNLVDIRPLPFSAQQGGGQAGGSASDHSLLINLPADDHKQYILLSGGAVRNPVTGEVDFTNGILTIPVDAAPGQTKQGSMRLNAVTNEVTVGDGVGRKTLADLTTAQTLSNKTLLVPTIANFTNAQHSHMDAATGGAVVSATTLTQGVIEIATQAEVNAGADLTRAVTPGTLANATSIPLPPQATTAAQGIIELATQAEVNAGTDAQRAVTPATLASATTTSPRTRSMSSTTPASSSSTTFGDAFGGLSLSPPTDGDYLVIFESDVSVTASNATVDIAVGKNSTLVADGDSTRSCDPGASNTLKSVVTTYVLIGLTTLDTVHGIYRKGSGSGSAALQNRRMTMMKINLS